MSRPKNPWLADAAVGATHQTYEIRTVEDFLKVPEDRRRICLREFDAWLSMRESIPKLIQAVAETLSPGAEVQSLFQNPELFAWMDDGRATVGISFDDGTHPDAEFAEILSDERSTSDRPRV